jgi:DNA-binding LacI/PurR family transcriptional regulator
MMRIKDVAREAGVSTATVSHVINNTRFVSDETRDKVLRAIERCAYYPNEQARSLASGRSRIIGVVVSDISNPFFPELVKSIEAAAFEHGYDVILANTDYDPERASNYVKRMIGRNASGVAVMTSELDLHLIDDLARRNVSVVFLDLGPHGRRMSNIIVDYEIGIEEAIEHLVFAGHRHIAYIGGPNRLRSATKRLEAFNASMSRHLPGTGTAQIFEGDFRLEGGRTAGRAILAANRLPTAVIAANDMMALGAMREFKLAGLSIPRDISIIGFDDIAFATLADPALTTISLSRVELGRKAVEALIETLEHPDHEGVEVHLPTHLIKRGTTAPVLIDKLRDRNREARKTGTLER